MALNQPHGPPARCGAKRRAGGTCGQPAMANGRCRYHGGLSLAGAEHPHFATGRYSKYLPERLAERARAAAEDRELFNLRDDIAAVEARIGELMERLGTDESERVWRDLRRQWGAYRRLADVGKAEAAAAALARVGALIERGAADGATWAEIVELMLARKTLIESERKRLMDMQQMVSVEDALVFVARLQDSIRRHVNDRDTLNAIHADFVDTIGGPAPRRPLD